MGRRPYMTQLALGRSAFEPLPNNPNEISGVNERRDSVPERSRPQNGTAVSDLIQESQGNSDLPVSQTSSVIETAIYRQQYDSRGHPENAASRELNRQSRRAMNDVLATVGVCVGVNPDGRHIIPLSDRSKVTLDEAKVHDVSIENTVGLLLDSVDLGLVPLVSMSMIGLRHRLQTFRFYAGIPIMQILNRERVHLGILGLLFPGAPARLMYSIIDLTGAWAIDTCMDLILGLFEYKRSRKSLAFARMVMGIIKWVLNIVAFAILAPIDMFSTLQTLGLLSGRPWLPHPRAFNPLSPSSPLRLPILPTSLTFDSIAKYLTSLAASPLFLWWIMGITKPIICTKLHAYIRAAIPKPYRPDKYSLEAAKEDELDNDSIPGLCNVRGRGQAEWESHNFLDALARDLQYIGYKYQTFYDCIANFFPRKSKSTSDEPVRHPSLDLRRDSWTTDTSSNATPNPSFAPSSRSTSPHPAVGVRNASTGTLHINLTLPVPNPNPESRNDVRHLDSPVTAIHDHDDKPRTIHQPLHRVTALTAYAANSFAHHLSSHIVDLLFLPLETRFIRSLALGFLSSPRADPLAQAAAARWKNEILPLGGWFGMGRRGRWSATGDYAGKIALVLGMEMGGSFTVWQLCTGFAWVSGRRMFGWGRL